MTARERFFACFLGVVVAGNAFVVVAPASWEHGIGGIASDVLFFVFLIAWATAPAGLLVHLTLTGQLGFRIFCVGAPAVAAGVAFLDYYSATDTSSSTAAIGLFIFPAYGMVAVLVLLALTVGGRALHRRLAQRV